tara:strand:+ start:433 stop:639 length:207 start_codon:yes stop_codon:yes gene_type:complete
MKKGELTEEDKKFQEWLGQFIEESGHAWGLGFFNRLKGTNEVLYRGAPEYGVWYAKKLEEYKKLQDEL